MVNINPISSAIDLKEYFKVNGGKSPADKGKGTATNSEVVEISSASSEFKTVKDAVDALPEIRIEKVEEIKRKIKINDYPVESRLDDSLKELWSSRIIV